MGPFDQGLAATLKPVGGDAPRVKCRSGGAGACIFKMRLAVPGRLGAWWPIIRPAGSLYGLSVWVTTGRAGYFERDRMRLKRTKFLRPSTIPV